MADLKGKPSTGHVVDTNAHISLSDRNNWNGKLDQIDFTNHTTDSDIHVSAVEKAMWNNALGGGLAVEKYLYGVNSINPLSTLHTQIPTIASFVSTRNKSANRFTQLNSLSISNAKTASLTTTSTLAPGIGKAKLHNGLILIVAQSSGTAYSLFLHNYRNGTTVPAGTASLSVTSANGTPGVSTMADGNVLIVVYSSSTTYNLYIYNPSTNTAVAAGTASLTVSTGGLAFGAATQLLPNGKVLIVVYASNSAYNLYLYDPLSNTAVAAGTPSLSATASGGAGIATSIMPDGRVLIVLRDSGASLYRFCVYDYVSNTASQITTESISSTGGVPAATLLPDGRVLVTCINVSAHVTYIYDINTDTVSEGPTITGTSPYQPGSALLPNGNVLLLTNLNNTRYVLNLYNYQTGTVIYAGVSTLPDLSVTTAGAAMLTHTYNGRLLAIFRNTTTAYKLMSIDGPFGRSNRYQFPTEMLFYGMV